MIDALCINHQVGDVRASKKADVNTPGRTWLKGNFCFVLFFCFSLGKSSSLGCCIFGNFDASFLKGRIGLLLDHCNKLIDCLLQSIHGTFDRLCHISTSPRVIDIVYFLQP